MYIFDLTLTTCTSHYSYCNYYSYYCYYAYCSKANIYYSYSMYTVYNGIVSLMDILWSVVKSHFVSSSKWSNISSCIIDC